MKVNQSLSFDFNGANIHYRIEGKGPTLLVLHGYCEDSFIWKEGIRKWSKTHSCITIDLPGFGGSTLTESPYHINDLADLVSALLVNLSIQQCVLFGHSMGGYVALAFAAKYPQYLRGLGLVHSHCFVDTEEKRNNRTKSIQFIEKHGAEPFLKSFYVNLFAADAFEKNKFIIDTLTRRNKNLSNEAIILGAKALISRDDHQQTLTNCPVPVFIYSGGHDSAIPSDYSLKMASMPAFCDFHFIEKIGHMGFYENKTHFEKSVLAFLERID